MKQGGTRKAMMMREYVYVMGGQAVNVSLCMDANKQAHSICTTAPSQQTTNIYINNKYIKVCLVGLSYRFLAISQQ
jgi:hypothetical protein